MVLTGSAAPVGSQSLTPPITTPPLEGGVPEPATWALMIMGFSAVGMAMRDTRRKSRAAIA